MNPYNYVGNNPETKTDPTGNYLTTATGGPAVAPVAPSGASAPPETPPVDLPPLLPLSITPPEIVIAIAGALGLVAANTKDLAPATVLLPYNTPFRSKSSFEVYGQDGPSISLSLPPQTQPGRGSGGGGGNNKPPAAPPPDFPGSTGGENKGIRVSQKGLDIVKNHLSAPDFVDPFTGEMAPENAAMIQRLEAALNEGNTISGADADFYFHELYESTLMDRGISYEDAHEQALNRYGVSPFGVYHPDVIRAFPDLFNPNWFRYWGLL